MPKIYTKNTWTNEVLAGPERYNIADNGGTPIDSNVQINLATSVAVAGSEVDASRMNNLEDGIDAIDSKLADILDSITTGGTSTAYTITTNRNAALVTGERFTVLFHTAAGATPTLNRDGKGAKSLKVQNKFGTLSPVDSTIITTGLIADVVYDGTFYIVLFVAPRLAHSDLTGVGTLTHAQLDTINKGYIQENSAQLSYVGAAAYDVLPGSADVNGTLLTWAANISRTGLTLSANTLYYVYLYSNSGTPAVEESTTAPVWDSALNYYKKTGDATRRCIGFIEASAANTIRKFLNTVQGRISEFLYISGTLTEMFVVNGGNTTGSWSSFSLAPLVPAHATHAYMNVRMNGATSGDDATIGVSPIDLGTASAVNAPSIVRGRAGANGANVFFGSAWFPIQTSQTYYYRMVINAGTPTANIEAHGSRIIR